MTRKALCDHSLAAREIARVLGVHGLGHGNGVPDRLRGVLLGRGGECVGVVGKDLVHHVTRSLLLRRSVLDRLGLQVFRMSTAVYCKLSGDAVVVL